MPGFLAEVFLVRLTKNYPNSTARSIKLLSSEAQKHLRHKHLVNGLIQIVQQIQ